MAFGGFTDRPAGGGVLPEATLPQQPRQDHGARFSSRSPLLALCAGSLRLGFRLLTHSGRSLVIRLPCRHGDLKGVWQSEHTSGFSDEGRRFGCSSH
jgi:hypothetical protein